MLREDAFSAFQIELKRSFNGLAPRYNCKSKNGLVQQIICNGVKSHKDLTEEDIENVKKYFGDNAKCFKQKCNWRAHLCQHIDGSLGWYFKMVGALDGHSLECFAGISYTSQKIKELAMKGQTFKEKKANSTRLYKKQDSMFMEG